MATFEEVLKLLKEGKSVELKIFLVDGLFGRHLLSLEDDKIQDFSYVDDSTNIYSIKEYKASFYGKAFQRKAVKIDESYPLSTYTPVNNLYGIVLANLGKQNEVSIIEHNLTKSEADAQVQKLKKQNLPAYHFKYKKTHTSSDAESCKECMREINRISSKRK